MNIDAKTGKTFSLFFIFFLLSTLAACKGEEKAMADDVVKEELVRPAIISEVLGFEGTSIRTFPALIEANKKSDLAFRVPGQLEKVTVKSGSQVKKGQLLAQIDSTDYQNAYDDRIAKLNLAKTKYKQTTTLFKKRYASQAEVDAVTAELKAAQVAVKQAKTDLTYTKLRAPFTGAISHVNIENFQFIQPQQTIVQLQNTNQLDVQFDIPETLIKSLKKSDKYKSMCGKVKLASDNKNEIKACYKEHDSVPDQATRSYPVLFSLKNPEDYNVLPGMSVDIELDFAALELANDNKGLLIPVEAVFDENDKQWVWKVTNDMRVTKTAVKVMGIVKDNIQIIEGLSVGDKVISAGVSYLKEGQKIRPLTKERGL
ncbi:efflux RND transporter periplasmic adaptor subunit [uncultured Cocleimonas sp.]|uniref:efflux RND transporter periplasmic adaptor subunit n=1 Tax=uncultured Cocleimonas sp. TaxID=1051587 RepID=UPI00263395E0|nr:efflux RND transporter periplasmic adaptor subunit [uncultured Cocleimonas sp.]